jgi:hypothetical protein
MAADDDDEPATSSATTSSDDSSSSSSSSSSAAKGDKAAALIAHIAATDDFYTILEVPRDADDATIKKSYRKAALRLHPDKCQLEGSKEAFQKLSAAFGDCAACACAAPCAATVHGPWVLPGAAAGPVRRSGRSLTSLLLLYRRLPKRRGRARILRPHRAGTQR